MTYVECPKCTFEEMCQECHDWQMDPNNYSKEDILYDLPGLIQVFGPDDELVKQYMSILAKRGAIYMKIYKRTSMQYRKLLAVTDGELEIISSDGRTVITIFPDGNGKVYKHELPEGAALIKVALAIGNNFRPEHMWNAIVEHAPHVLDERENMCEGDEFSLLVYHRFTQAYGPTQSNWVAGDAWDFIDGAKPCRCADCEVGMEAH